MWKLKKPAFLNRGADLPKPVVAALIISALSLVISIGLARWSWLLLDEQIALRNEVMEMKGHQEQSDTQYEAWLAGMNKLWNQVQATKTTKK